MELPDLRQVRSLVAVAETESFTKAAERLHVTQSAVSHSIRALETQLDCKLLERSGKRAALSQHGMILVRRFRAALGELEKAGEELGVLKRWGQGRLRVGVTHSLCSHMLPEVMREFKELYPRCEIHIESEDTQELIDILERAEIDLVLGIGGRCPGWARFERIFEEELVFVVSSSHPWAELGEVPLAEVEKESFLVYARASETYRLLKASFEKIRRQIAAGIESGRHGGDQGDGQSGSWGGHRGTVDGTTGNRIRRAHCSSAGRQEIRAGVGILLLRVASPFDGGGGFPADFPKCHEGLLRSGLPLV